MRSAVKNILVTTAMLMYSLVCLAQGYDYNYPQRQNGGRQQQRGSQQDKSDQGFHPTSNFMVSIGYSGPLGNFATATGINYNGNFALGGISEVVSAGILVGGTNIGIGLMYRGDDNPFDMNTFMLNLYNSNPNAGYYSPYSDFYSSNAFLAGIYYTWPVKRFSFDLRALAGVMVTVFPEVTYGAPAPAVTNGPVPSNDYQWDYAPSTGAAFAYDIGGSIRCKLRRRWCVSVNADYCGARPSFNTVLTYTDDYGNETPYAVSGSSAISLLSFTVGVGYQFN